MKLDYVDVPLLLKIAADSEQRFFLLAGPSLGFLMNATVRDFDDDEPEDVKPALNGVDFGFVLGGGVSFGKWLVDLRYSAGLRTFEKEEFRPPADEVSKNRSLMVLFGVHF